MPIGDAFVTAPTGFFGWVWLILRQYWPLFLEGTKNTLIIAISGTILGFGLGLLIAIGRATQLGKNPVRRVLIRLLHGFLGAYIEAFRGTPMIVQAMVIYYGLVQGVIVQAIHKTNPSFQIPGLAVAVFIVSINTAAYIAEIIRGGIISVDVGQTEAAHSIGLTHWQTMVSVVLPQAIRNIMPSIGNEFVVNIKDSSVLNVIAVTELYFQTASAAGTYLRYFEAFAICAIIYLILTITVTRILRFVERKMDGPENYTVRIHGSQTDSRAELTLPVKEGGGA